VAHLEAQSLKEFVRYRAGLNDQAIFDRTLERLDNSRPEERQRFETIFAENPHIQRRCLVLCRKGKEEYFSNADLYRSEDERVACSLKFRTIQPAIEFEPSLYHEEMERVLNRPLKNWRSAVGSRRFLLRFRKPNAKWNTTARIDILTGGASRMGFVHPLCQEVFCDVEEIVRGAEPEFTIAKGLARIGGWIFWHMN
jgi:molecular chaperone DnaK (HSP70)